MRGGRCENDKFVKNDKKENFLIFVLDKSQLCDYNGGKN